MRFIRRNGRIIPIKDGSAKKGKAQVELEAKAFAAASTASLVAFGSAEVTNLFAKDKADTSKKYAKAAVESYVPVTRKAHAEKAVNIAKKSLKLSKYAKIANLVGVASLLTAGSLYLKRVRDIKNSKLKEKK